MIKRPFEHIGGHPLLDFINTKMTPNGQNVDLLATNEDVVFWLNDMGILARDSVQFNWGEDVTLRQQVCAFREKMREIITDIVAERSVSSKSVQAINDALLSWQGHPQLSQDGAQFIRQLDFAIKDSEQLIAVLADTAVHFLTTTNLHYVKKCGNGECTRYFLDTSKNHSRRWCSMEGCGNRMKARAHYARKK